MYSIHDNHTNMSRFSHLTKFSNMCLLNRIYSTFSCPQIRQCLLQIFISFFSFLIYLCCLILTIASYNRNLFSCGFCFLVLYFKFFNKFIYFFLCLFQFNFFFLQIDFELLYTLSCFLKFIKSKPDILVLNIDCIVLLLVHIFIQVNE